MANTIQFGGTAGVTAIAPVGSVFGIFRTVTAGAALNPIFSAALGYAPQAFRIIDFMAWNNFTAPQTSGVATAQVTEGAAGGNAVSDAVAIQLNDAIGRAATLDVAFNDIAVTDSLNITVDANTTVCVAMILAYYP